MSMARWRRPQPTHVLPHRASMTTPSRPVRPSAHNCSMTDTVAFEPLWSIEQVAQFTAVPVSTLYSLRSARRGPPGARVGRSLRFDPMAVRRWFNELTDASEARA